MTPPTRVGLIKLLREARNSISRWCDTHDLMPDDDAELMDRLSAAADALAQRVRLFRTPSELWILEQWAFNKCIEESLGTEKLVSEERMVDEGQHFAPDD